jgi:hypothetical protein
MKYLKITLLKLKITERVYKEYNSKIRVVEILMNNKQ